MTVCVIVGVGG